jgi:hypothetical protein
MALLLAPDSLCSVRIGPPVTVMGERNRYR